MLTHCRQEREENVAELGKDVHSQGVHHLSCGCYGNSLVAESTLSTLPKKSLCHLSYVYIPDVYHEYYTLFIASFPGPSRQVSFPDCMYENETLTLSAVGWFGSWGFNSALLHDTHTVPRALSRTSWSGRRHRVHKGRRDKASLSFLSPPASLPSPPPLPCLPAYNVDYKTATYTHTHTPHLPLPCASLQCS